MVFEILTNFGRHEVRKQSYILFVARRRRTGQLRKIRISLNYLYTDSGHRDWHAEPDRDRGYIRAPMLVKVHSFNKLRRKKISSRSQYTRLEKVARQERGRASRLAGFAASEVSSLYGLKAERRWSHGAEHG